jgi:DNA repair protein RadA/Sms
MAKQINLFVCSSCGAEYARWSGRCEQCDSWNTIAETSKEAVKNKKQTSARISDSTLLSDVDNESVKRVLTPIGEFNLVCGGGIVPGSVILIGGEPGIGKSTLSLMIAGSMNTLYVSGEESVIQIRQRADRIGINTKHVLVSTNTEIESIVDLVKARKPDALLIDSIQTTTVADITAPAGSVTQVRESAARLTDVAKERNIPVFIVGHITKDGAIAGPKILEHIVDTVLYFEGDFTHEYRILRSFKNRYGSVNEIGIFKMTPKGLEEVKDRNAIFLNPSMTHTAGSAISAAIEGSRTILFEIQALATFSTFSNPRRMSDGLDLNRLILLAAVLEKHAGIKCSNNDLFLNVAGGFTIRETSADLAVAMSIASSVLEKPLSQKTAFLGEISLSGELRPVSQIERRVTELFRSGFNRIILSEKDAEECRTLFNKGDFVGVSTIGKAMNISFS